MLSNHDVNGLSPRVVETISSNFELGYARPRGVPSSGARYVAYRLSTPLGDFALIRPRQKSASEIREKKIGKDLTKAHEIILHLARRNFPVAAPLETAKGSTITTIEGIPYVLYPFVNGRPMALQSAFQVRAAGASLGRYHRLMSGYDHSIVSAESFLPKQFRERLIQFKATRTTVGKLGVRLGFAETLDWLEETLPSLESDIFELPYDRLPKVTIHGDYRSPNILFRQEKLAAVIDFHRSRYDAQLLDVAIALSDLVLRVPNGNALDLSAEFVSGYETIQPMRRIEKDALPILTQARVAWRTFRRFRRLNRRSEMTKRIRRARKFRRYAERLRWMRSTQPLWEEMLA